MSNAKHTPGPWVKDGFDWVGSNGEKVVMSGGPSFGSSATWPSAEANARLIAAAPELLEALEAWEKAIPRLDEFASVSPDSLRGKALAAIAKARGE